MGGIGVQVGNAVAVIIRVTKVGVFVGLTTNGAGAVAGRSVFSVLFSPTKYAAIVAKVITPTMIEMTRTVDAFGNRVMVLS